MIQSWKTKKKSDDSKLENKNKDESPKFNDRYMETLETTMPFDFENEFNFSKLYRLYVFVCRNLYLFQNKVFKLMKFEKEEDIQDAIKEIENQTENNNRFKNFASDSFDFVKNNNSSFNFKIHEYLKSKKLDGLKASQFNKITTFLYFSKIKKDILEVVPLIQTKNDKMIKEIETKLNLQIDKKKINI